MFSSGKHEILWTEREYEDHKFLGSSPLTNPVNPILAEFRNVYPGHTITPERIARYLRYIADPDASSEDDPSWTNEQREHTRAVLTRLAAFGGTK